jgi:hypothetical protein
MMIADDHETYDAVEHQLGVRLRRARALSPAGNASTHCWVYLAGGGGED